MTVQIIEVLRRSEQGMTRPFICRGDDDEIYFVKGIGAGRRSQICEWIAGNLGLALGLPIAPFEIVEVPEELLQIPSVLSLSELGSGEAFGSKRQDDAMELNMTVIHAIPEALQQDVLTFDWWIRNNDRLLTPTGGNPNLFWNPRDRELIVIDHNQAFDAEFDSNNFLDYHIFHSQKHQVFGDMLRRQDYTQRFFSALNHWHGICAGIPKAWFFTDMEMTVPVNFSLDGAYAMLEAYKKEDFWNTL
ncbi:HipA family kinase [Nitrosomonas sp.]|uniref:HipA family kinase n=1 Tax=Nitrosomonas sp. TaxID=42353 RepID=UPI001D40EC1F|nr:HipA family kinase [Nitrosomonas sp.]MBX3615964.1 hypothetical protein [Nitrosomonas sp.]